METWDGLMETLYWDDLYDFVANCKSIGMEVVGHGMNVSIKCGRSLLQFVSSYTQLTGEFRMDWKFSTERKFNDKLIIKEFYKFMDNAPFSIDFCLDHDNSKIIVVPWDDVNEDWHDDNAEPFVGSVSGRLWIIGG